MEGNRPVRSQIVNSTGYQKVNTTTLYALLILKGKEKTKNT